MVVDKNLQAPAFSVVGVIMIAHAVPGLLAQGATNRVAAQMERLDPTDFGFMFGSIDVGRWS